MLAEAAAALGDPRDGRTLYMAARGCLMPSDAARTRTAVSHMWPLIARALGVHLRSLCDDTAWIAAQPVANAAPRPPSLRDCGKRARATARAIASAKGIALTELARAVVAADAEATGKQPKPHIAVCSFLEPHCAIAASRWWPHIAAALGVTLRDLCDDPAWLDKQAALADRAPQVARLTPHQLASLRPCAVRARARLREIMAARGLSRRHVVRIMVRDVADAAATREPPAGAYSVLNTDAPTVSRYWHIAARALGITLADLCPDPAWIAAQPLDA